MGKHRPRKLSDKYAAQGKKRPAVSRYAVKKMARLAEEGAARDNICTAEFDNGGTEWKGNKQRIKIT